MIVLGILLMVLGWVFSVPVLWTLGIVALVIGVVLYAAGSMGHAVGGRRHYY